MFQFAHTYILYFLLIVPVLFVLYIVSTIQRKKALESFGESRLLNMLMPDYSSTRIKAKFYLVLLAITLLVVAVAGPQFGSKLEEVKRKGVEVVIALDVSNSMLAEDIKPNRLERSKMAISKMVDKMNNDRIGLIVFAGEAYTQVPVTTDYLSAKMFLSTLSTDVVPVQGTNIASAIELAMNSFSPTNEKNKALVIITDGEDHQENAVDLAVKAKEKGIIVHTIGMGLPKGVPIPTVPGSSNPIYRKDKDGNVVISKLNEEILQKVAAAGGGTYQRANNSQIGLNKLFDEINKMENKYFKINSN